MSTVFRRASYAYKLMFSGYFIGAVLLGIVFSFVTINIETWHFAEASLPTLVVMFTVVMPLLTIILTANAFAEELEELTFPLVWTYPVNKPLLVLERLLLVLLLIAFYMGATFWAIHLLLLELTWEVVWDILKISSPTHLFLASITLFFSLIGRNMLVGLAAGALYWLVEMMTLGKWTKGLFIFQPVWPLEDYDPMTQGWWILGIASMLIAMCVTVFFYGRHWIAKSKQ